MRDRIAYKAGYKYQLAADYTISLFRAAICPEQAICADFYSLDTHGLLTIRKGYAWDGPSGPTIDTLNFMRGSLVHDALYQIMREKHLDHAAYRELADRVLQQICREDGMSALRAWWVYQGVRFGGGSSADPDYDRPIVYAPSERLKQC